MINIEHETEVTLTLTGESRFEWQPGNLEYGPFVCERIRARLYGRGRVLQAIYLQGPWIETPVSLVGHENLAVTGWDHLYVELAFMHRRFAALPVGVRDALARARVRLPISV